MVLKDIFATVPSASDRRGGRPLPHQRKINDDVPVVGEDLDLGDDCDEETQATLRKQMKDATKKDIQKTTKHFDKNYPACIHKGGAREITEEERLDPKHHCFNGRYGNRDLVCEGPHDDNASTEA